MHCPQCHHQNTDTAKFCEECGTRLITACSHCGQPVHRTVKFCAECGTPLTGHVASSTRHGASAQPSPPPVVDPGPRLSNTRHTDGERRQLTIMFCDLVDSTALSTRLDPEDLREVIRRYQDTCAQVIQRFDGYIAQYLGDGLLVYFGYPQAHEDDAARAVRAGLDTVSALQTTELQVRIGIHTGPVVISEIGRAERRELLALGETPNIAARVQSQASPQTIVISAATQQLVHGLFTCQELGARPLKGLSTPLALYQVERESEAQSRFEVAIQRGLTPLIGREHEVGLLSERWERAKQAEGQVVLLSGEPGIGKSRLVQVMREHAEQDGALRIEFRCSPYHQNSAFYPIIDHLHRLLHVEPNDSSADRLGKLEHALTAYRFPQADTVPLLAALLSLPQPAHYPTLNISPQRQKQKTQEVLVAWLIEEAEGRPLYCPWEDIHWADPSTLELLTMLIDHVPTARLYLLLTFRPEFVPPWSSRSHMSHLTLSRLGRGHVTQMIAHVARERTLPAEMFQQIVAKTDGVPLFVEELTKMVVESEGTNDPMLQHTIPATLQDSLMARLDRLGPAKEIAQLGATIGREFSHELLQAISPLEEEVLQQGLSQLVNAELVYQRGVLPHRQYLFKHALIQDAAYHSVLKSRRQQLHQQIANVLEEQFKEITETQPELLAHHYTEAELKEQAIPYWQRAGEKAVERSANAEAIRHLSKGLALLNSLPGTAVRDQHELTLQLALGTAQQATNGLAAPETGATYARARELCHQISGTPQLFPVLFNLWIYSNTRREYSTAATLARQLLDLAEQAQDPALFLQAHHATWTTAFAQGNFVLARDHLEQGDTIYHPQQHHTHAFLYGGHDPGVCGRGQAAWVLWMLGYPDHASQLIRASLTLADELSHPMSLAVGLSYAANYHQFRREPHVVQEHAEAVLALCREQGLPFHLAWGTIMRGWALAEQGDQAEGIAQMRHGLAAHRATGAGLTREYFLGLLAAGYRNMGQPAEGLLVVAEALAVVATTGNSMWEAELYRLQGELTLEASVRQPQSPVPAAEESFLKAIEISRTQQAKSLELRATTSLARLWQSQEKRHEAHQVLSEIYYWFTEGFDTKDLQEAKTLLDALAEGH